MDGTAEPQPVAPRRCTSQGLAKGPLFHDGALVLHVGLCQAFHQLSGSVDEGTPSASNTAGHEDGPGSREAMGLGPWASP